MGCNCPAASIFIRIVGFFSVILAMCLLGICGWTLANTFKPTTLGFLDIQTGINQDSYYNNRNNNSTAPAAEEINKNGTILTLQSSSSSVILEETNEHNNNNNDSPNFIRIWETMSPKFKRIIQICTSAAIGIGIFQLLVSMTILCSTQKRLRGTTKFWQLVNFIIVLLFLMCILVPFSYNREKDKFRGALTFGKYIKTEVTNLILYHSKVNNNNNNNNNNTEEAEKEGENGVKFGFNAILEFFITDLNSYYIILSLNVVFIFSFLLMTCCCVQCTAKNYYQSV